MTRVCCANHIRCTLNSPLAAYVKNVSIAWRRSFVWVEPLNPSHMNILLLSSPESPASFSILTHLILYFTVTFIGHLTGHHVQLILCSQSEPLTPLALPAFLTCRHTWVTDAIKQISLFTPMPMGPLRARPPGYEPTPASSLCHILNSWTKRYVMGSPLLQRGTSRSKNIPPMHFWNQA